MPWLSKPKVVIDTNVFVSGVLFGGNPEKILHQVSQRIISLVITPDVKAEILRKLEKFKVGQADLEKWNQILDGCHRVVPTIKVNVCRDPKDNMFLEACLESGADFIITGDKDLLIIKKFKETLIISPAEFLQK